MDPTLILGIVKMTMEIIENHTGPKLSPEAVTALINVELAKGRALIDLWFANKNLPPPK